jgi:hypothetical protein
MKRPITIAIVKHILDNFGITAKRGGSINDSSFLIQEDLILLDEDEKEQKVLCYGAEVPVEGDGFRVIYFKLSSDEHVLITKLEECPTYACYLLEGKEQEDASGLVALLSDSGKWVECDVAMQANFLSGIERLNYIDVPWSKISESKDMIDSFKSYLEYLDSKNP